MYLHPCLFFVLAFLGRIGVDGEGRRMSASRARKRMYDPRPGGAREPSETLLISATYSASAALYDSSSVAAHTRPLI